MTAAPMDVTSARHDASNPRGGTACYVICSTPRSGRTLLARGLWSSGAAGRPMEYFNPNHRAVLEARWGSDGLAGYARDLRERRSSENGRFGFKLHYHHYVQQLGDAEVGTLFPGLRHIHIVRRNRARQAVSFHRARRSGQWTHSDPARAVPEYSFPEILECHLRIVQWDEGWEEHFRRQGIAPHRVLYEDLVESYEQEIRRALRFLDVAAPERIEPPALRVQSDPRTEEWEARYLETLRRHGLTVER